MAVKESTATEGATLYLDTFCLIGTTVVYEEVTMPTDLDLIKNVIDFEKYNIANIRSGINFLPITCSDPDLSCRVMETLAYHSMLNVVPTYYTVALENKYTRDEDVPEMLALIREGMTMNFDFAFSTTQHMGGTNVVFMDANGNLASHLASKEKQWNTGIEKLIAGLE